MGISEGNGNDPLQRRSNGDPVSPLEAKTLGGDSPVSSGSSLDFQRLHAPHANLEIFEMRVAELARNKPEFAFNPADPWAKTFRHALDTLDYGSGLKIVEVGVGLGVNVALLLTKHPENEVWGSDFVPGVIPKSEELVAELTGTDRARGYRAVPGSSDLLEHWLSGGQFHGQTPDLIVCCIPQVIDPRSTESNDELSLEDRLEQLRTSGEDAAHYYVPSLNGVRDEHFKKFVSLMDEYNLGLNARLLVEAREVLTPESGRIVMNLAGRVPLPILHTMFRETGFEEPRIVHQTIVRQDDVTTSIMPLAATERKAELAERMQALSGSETDHRFVFYDNPDGRGRPLCATEAYSRERSRQPNYHDLYVLESRPKPLS